MLAGGEVDVFGGDVEVSPLPRPTGRDVERLTRRRRGDERVGGVDSGALDAVHGEGLAELHMAGDVLAWEESAPPRS